MSISYDQKTWYNGEEGGTPITASELNRMEQGIADAVEAINEGGGGQGGGAHTNLDNIANTTTNSNTIIASKQGKSELRLKFCYVENNKFVSLSVGKTYISQDGANWEEQNNNLSSIIANDSIAAFKMSKHSTTYVAVILTSSLRVFLCYSYDLLNWTKSLIVGGDLDHNTNGYEIDINCSWYANDNVCVPFNINNNCSLLFVPLIYNDDTTTYPPTRCLTSQNGTSWSVATTTPSDFADTMGYKLYNAVCDSNTNYRILIAKGNHENPIEVWANTTTTPTTFAKISEITLENEDEFSDGRFYECNGKYYIQCESGGICCSNDLINWSYKSCDYLGRLVGFNNGFMLLYEYSPCSLTYLKANSSGVYPCDSTRQAVVGIEGCGIIDLPTLNEGSWQSTDEICSNGSGNVELNVQYLIDTLNNLTNVNNIRLFTATPFVNEVSLAANILGLGSGSGGGSGTSDYPDLTNKPRINGVELLGNKLVGLLSTDIQINAEKIGYSGTVSGANTAKAAIESLKSSIDNISVDADDVSYDNTTSGLTATNVQDAIDEVNSAKGNASVSVVPNTYTELYRLTNGSTGSNYDVYSSHYIRQMLDNSLRTSIDTYQPNIIPVTTLVTLKTYSSADYGKTVNLVCQFSTYTGAFDSSGNAIFNVGYVGEYVIEIDTHSRGTIFINSIGGCYHFPLSNDGIDVAFRTRDVKLIGQQLGVFDTSNNMVAKFKLTKDDYWIAIPSPSSTYVVKLYHTVNSSISQATVTVSAQFVPNTADEVLCTYPSNNEFDPIVIKDTADLTAGTSPLADGTIYLVYE